MQTEMVFPMRKSEMRDFLHSETKILAGATAFAHLKTGAQIED